MNKLQRLLILKFRVEEINQVIVQRVLKFGKYARGFDTNYKMWQHNTQKERVERMAER